MFKRRRKLPNSDPHNSDAITNKLRSTHFETVSEIRNGGPNEQKITKILATTEQRWRIFICLAMRRKARFSFRRRGRSRPPLPHAFLTRPKDPIVVFHCCGQYSQGEAWRHREGRSRTNATDQTPHSSSLSAVVTSPSMFLQQRKHRTVLGNSFVFLRFLINSCLISHAHAVRTARCPTVKVYELKSA